MQVIHTHRQHLQRPDPTDCYCGLLSRHGTPLGRPRLLPRISWRELWCGVQVADYADVREAAVVFTVFLIHTVALCCEEGIISSGLGC